MLGNAILRLSTANGNKVIAIPVINFPILPIGTLVTAYLSAEIFFEDAVIQEYRLDTRYGVIVSLNLAPGLEITVGNEIWKDISNICVEDPEKQFDLIYPKTIDFGATYPATK